MFAFKESVSEFGKNIGSKVKLTSRKKPPMKSLSGQTIIVTGSNRGMGKVVVEELSSRGARVIIACRNTQAGEDAMNDIKSRHPTADLAVYQLDLASFASIHTFVGSIMQKEKRLDVLINNAAVVTAVRSETIDGHETAIQVNYYSAVMLILLLTPFMEKTSKDARIIVVGALGHSYVKGIKFDDMESLIGKYSPFNVYLHSKLALMSFTRELAIRRSANRGSRVYCVDPGVSPTELASDTLPKNALAAKFAKTMLATIGRSVEQAADSIVHVVLFEKEGYNPRVYYFMDGEPKALSAAAQDDQLTARLWQVTSDVVPIMKSLND